MSPKKVLVALPSKMLEEIDFIAIDEHRSRSDLIREALRRYTDNYKRTRIKPTPKQPNNSFEKEIEEAIT
jgi:metal-responsive CopG/Arc/MetJ family transcriptional regulator